MACSFSGEWPTQSTSSPTTRSGSRLRKDCVGFPGEPLIRDVGVVLECTCRLNDVDTPAALTRSELSTPDGGVEGGGEVDVVHHLAVFEVRLAAGTSTSPTARSAFVPCRYSPGS